MVSPTESRGITHRADSQAFAEKRKKPLSDRLNLLNDSSFNRIPNGEAPPLGASPRRLAAFGRPGSLKRSSHPASPMMSRLRRHAFCWIGGLFKRCASTATAAPAAPSQLAFQKSQTDRAAIHRRGQGRRKRRGRGDFRAAGAHRGRSARLERSSAPCGSTGFLGGRFFGS